MKFIIRKYCSSQSRLGLLLFESIENNVELSHEYLTPICFQYTINGSIPHIVWDNVEDLRDEKSPILITLPTTVEMSQSLHNFNKTFNGLKSGIVKFVGINHLRPSFLSIQDPLKAIKSGHNGVDGIAVFAHSGKHTINSNKMMEIINNFKPNGYQAICDSDTPFGASNKRVRNSVERSLTLLDECLEKHVASKQLKDNKTCIFGTIEGGFNPLARLRSTKETALRPVDGFIIDGFHTYGEEIDTNFEMESIKPLLIDVIKNLPKEKPKAMFGAFPPNIILHLINNGIDIFDSSYATVITERGHALQPIIDLNELKLNNSVIDLNKEEFKEDFNPICKGCECYTCSEKFSKAYINHLLLTSEMLAQVLLMFHNLHTFYEFFRQIRKLLDEEKFEQLIKKL
jgi:queuine tRNA-ribosyltransferase subunit QTRTD1